MTLRRVGKELWAANATDGDDLDSRPGGEEKVVETLDADVKSANRLKFTPDGKTVLVSVLNGPDVSVFDVTTRKLKKRIPVGAWGGGDRDAAARHAGVRGLYAG